MPSDLVDFELDEGLAAVAVFDDYIKAGEAGLAILAMGEAYWMILHAGRLCDLCHRKSTRSSQC